jgi:hypothetical protein
MRPEDLLELLRAKPFEPFRLHLSDGAAYEIRHRDFAIVQRSKITIALPGTDQTAPPSAR